MPDKWKSTVELVCCGLTEGTSEPSQGQAVCIPQKYHSDVLHFHSDGRVAQQPVFPNISLYYVHNIIFWTVPIDPDFGLPEFG